MASKYYVICVECKKRRVPIWTEMNQEECIQKIKRCECCNSLSIAENVNMTSIKKASINLSRELLIGKDGA